MCHLSLGSNRCADGSLGITGVVSLRSLSSFLNGLRKFERVLGVLLNEGNQALQRAVTFIVDEVTRTSGLELDGRETLDTEGNADWEIILGCLKFGTV